MTYWTYSFVATLPHVRPAISISCSTSVVQGLPLLRCFCGFHLRTCLGLLYVCFVHVCLLFFSKTSVGSRFAFVNLYSPY